MANKGLMDIIKAAKKMRLQYPKKYSKWTDYVKAASKQLKPVAKKSVGKVSELPFPKEKKQTGSSNKKYDIMHQAKPVGKRKATSAAKRPYYYEYRANRTDKGKLLGLHKDSNSHNVNIKVMSGTDDFVKQLKNLVDQKKIMQRDLDIYKTRLKDYPIKNWDPFNVRHYKKLPAMIKSISAQIREVKKHIQ